MNTTYVYDEYHEYPMTREGQKVLFKTREFMKEAITVAGVVRANRVVETVAADTPTNFHAMSCIDYLVELGEFKEVQTTYPKELWSRRIFY